MPIAPPTSRSRRVLVFVSASMLLGGALVAAGMLVWTAAAAEPSRGPGKRALLAALAVALLGAAGKNLVWDASRTRHPRWNVASAVVTVLWAAYFAFLAIRGL